MTPIPLTADTEAIARRVIWFEEPAQANAEALFRALVRFGAPLEALTPRDFAERGSFSRMGTPPVMVDIIPGIAGVTFDHAWAHRVMGMIDAAIGLEAPFISADDLVSAKQATGRAQDPADVEALRLARRQRGSATEG